MNDTKMVCILEATGLFDEPIPKSRKYCVYPINQYRDENKFKHLFKTLECIKINCMITTK